MTTSGYVNGIIEDGGSCAFTLTSGASSVTTTTTGQADTSTTSCGQGITPDREAVPRFVERRADVHLPVPENRGVTARECGDPVKPFRLVAAALALALTFTVVSAFAAGQPAAQAADGRQFDPGDIISDALFFDGGVDERRRRPGVPQRQGLHLPRRATPASRTTARRRRRRPAVAGRCARVRGRGERDRASAIIAKVGAACGISQKVLIVLLEKEQGLVTDDFPGSGQYRLGDGLRLPGHRRLRRAVLRLLQPGLQRRAAVQALRGHPDRAGTTSPGACNAVRYNPNAACGSGNVFIQNQATAGLYNYTPYQPNAAALANLYGTGDGCSAYGNRNFWRIYTDWFGSTIAGTSLLRTVSDRPSTSSRARTSTRSRTRRCWRRTRRSARWATCPPST